MLCTIRLQCGSNMAVAWGLRATLRSCAPLTAPALHARKSSSNRQVLSIVLQVAGQRGAMQAPTLFKEKEFNFEKLGIGGLDTQFEQIFRRAFASRVFFAASLRTN